MYRKDGFCQSPCRSGLNISKLRRFPLASSRRPKLLESNCIQHHTIETLFFSPHLLHHQKLIIFPSIVINVLTPKRTRKRCQIWDQTIRFVTKIGEIPTSFTTTTIIRPRCTSIHVPQQLTVLVMLRHTIHFTCKMPSIRATATVESIVPSRNSSTNFHENDEN